MQRVKLQQKFNKQRKKALHSGERTRKRVAVFTGDCKGFYKKLVRTGHLICIRYEFLVAPPHPSSVSVGP